jgi:hypothetical protein
MLLVLAGCGGDGPGGTADTIRFGDSTGWGDVSSDNAGTLDVGKSDSDARDPRYPDGTLLDHSTADSLPDWFHTVDNGHGSDWTPPADLLVDTTPPPLDSDNDGVPDEFDPFPNDPSMPGVVLPMTVYAHTSSKLFLMDVKTEIVKEIGSFKWPGQGTSHQMTDIAIDYWGVMYGVSFNDLYVVHPETAKCAYLANLPDSFNGLTMVPKGLIDPAKEVLVGITQGGDWYRLTVNGGTVSYHKLGSYGYQYGSSGDAYSIQGVGTYAAVNKSVSSDDYLVELNPLTGKVVAEIGPITGYSDVWGLAGWTGKAFAFDAGGAILLVDTTTATVKLIKQTPHAWWGAGVRTRLDE